MTVALSTAQINFITDLGNQYEQFCTTAGHDVRSGVARRWVARAAQSDTREDASTLIDRFVAHRNDARTAARYAVAPRPHSTTAQHLADAVAATVVVPAGHYAVDGTGTQSIDFFRVTYDRAQRPRIARIIGGRPGGASVPYRTWGAILDRIQAAGIENAAVRYGATIGRCHVCNRILTDDTSRALGIGPDCRGGSTTRGAAWLAATNPAARIAATVRTAEQVAADIASQPPSSGECECGECAIGWHGTVGHYEVLCDECAIDLNRSIRLFARNPRRLRSVS